MLKAMLLVLDRDRCADKRFALCESRWATSTDPIHIRRLTEAGHKFTGNIDTASLCSGLPVKGGWDISLKVNSRNLKDPRICPGCVHVYAIESIVKE